MQNPWWQLLIAVGVSLVFLVRAHAQPVFAYTESIESTVANADIVVIAKLKKFDAGKQTSEREVLHEAIIAIEEVLKNDIYSSGYDDGLSIQVHEPVSNLARWKDRSSRLLVAVNASVPNETTLIELADEGMEVFAADFKVLRDSEAVVRVAKESVRRIPAPVKRIHTFPLSVPREAFAGTKWQGYAGLRLSVPVDERLEKRARDYLDSDNFMKREEGVRALRFFKSDDNIARIKSLLNDPGWAYLHHPQENNGVEVRHYGVRDEAYRTLKFWGVDVEKPKVREVIRKCAGPREV